MTNICNLHLSISSKMCIGYTFMILTIIALPCKGYAVTDTIYASYDYTMGDNDSKNDSRRIAFIEAKRRAVEKVGVFIQSETTVTDSALSKDEIKSYTAAIIKVEIEKEEFHINGGSQTLTTTVRAVIDTDDVQKRLKTIVEDKTLQRKIREQQKQLAEMDDKILKLQKQINNASTDEAVPLRKERNKVLTKMTDVDQIVQHINKTSNKARTKVRSRMTQSEVKKIVGAPRSEANTRWGDCECWNYGDVWVIFEHGLVIGLADDDKYKVCNFSKPKNIEQE